MYTIIIERFLLFMPIEPGEIGNPKPEPSAPASPDKEVKSPLKPENLQNNYDVVRASFLNIDSAGRCRMEQGVCGDAFVELKNKCGDSTAWTEQDMEREDIHDLVMAYRTFGILFDNRPLIPEEIEMLKKLFNRQQEINQQQNRPLKEVDKIREALQRGIKFEDRRRAAYTNQTFAVWAKPGKDMPAALTGAIVRLYYYDLRRTDAARAQVTFPHEFIPRRMTEAEEALILKHLLALEEMRKKEEEERRKKQDQTSESEELQNAESDKEDPTAA